MRIQALEVESYQAIRHVEIRPGDRSLVIVGGRNRQGKSSILSALAVALGGKKHAGPEPVRHGDRAATITVELGDESGIAYTIERRITAGGKYTLELRAADGTRKRSPQALLDAIVGARFLDPLQFLTSPPRAQREMLLRCVDLGDVDLDQLADQRARAYERRTTVGRELSRAKAELANLGPVPDEAAPPTPVGELVAELRALDNADDERKAATAALDGLDAEQRDVERRIAVLTERLEELRAARPKAEARVARMMPAEELASRRTELAGKLASAEQANRDAVEVGVRRRRHEELDERVRTVGAEHEQLTTTIAELDERKARALRDAPMPIAGLEVGDAGVLYNGAPFEQAADSERLQASLAIAVALSPQLRDVWIRDGSLLDDDALEAVRRFADERGCRVWIERVGAGDDGAIVIEAGEIVPAGGAA